MTAIVVTEDIDRPAQAVFDYATDPTEFSAWQNGVVSGQMNSSGPPTEGDLCTTTRRIGGAERPSTSRLVKVEPPRAWSVRGIDGPIRALVDLKVQPLSADRSRLTISLDFEGHGIGRVLVPLLVRREARKEMPGNIATLKRLIEADPG